MASATVMQEANRLRRVMNEGKGPAVGCWQMIPGANVSRVMARTGVDWILIDCEHGNIDGKPKLFYFSFFVVMLCLFCLATVGS